MATISGIDAIISSAVHCGYGCDLGRQRLFDLGMLVEDDPAVQRSFHQNKRRK